MARAAVPKYLDYDIRDVSPGLRFGLLLPAWREDFTLDKRGNPLAAVCKLSKDDQLRQQALVTRQQQLVNADSNILSIEATAIAPFMTGLGNEHPLENGFAFLNPHGLPYLPGSGVKGVLREAARQLTAGEWGHHHGWSDEKRFAFPVEDKEQESAQLSMLDVFFGTAVDGDEGEGAHLRGVLDFWDVIPVLEGGNLDVDIMTPHQGHYYQQPEQGAFVSPHDSGQPIPIAILTVPPGSRFHFHVRCDVVRLRALAPDLVPVPAGKQMANEPWRDLVVAAFEHAFEWLGFGAKTALGYGAMISQDMKERDAADARERLAAQQAEGKARAQAEQIASAQSVPGARITFNKKNRAMTASKDNKHIGIAIAPNGDALLNTVSPAVRQKILNGEYVRLTVRVTANRMLLGVEES